jgi:hypothetical protein
MTLAHRCACAAASLLAAVAVLAPNAAWAATSVTVYSRDLGFVRETRVLDLAGARDTVRIDDIPERIDVTSMRLTTDGGKVSRLAYRYDVANGDQLLENARGRKVRVTLREDRPVEGTLVTADGAWVVVREDDGGLRNLSRGSIDDVRLAAPPARLFTRPGLEAVVEGGKRGKTNAELSYLTGGLSWTAEHVLTRTGETTATWEATVNVENTTGRDFVNTELKLVAGDPRRDQSMPPPMPQVRAMAMEAKAAGGADLAQEDFSEYHLYTLGHPATLRDRENQKLTMIEPHRVKITPRYLFRGAEGRGVRSQIELQNTQAAGLGVPLAGGRVRIYEPDASGDLQFTGESRIGHTPEGEKVTLDVGTAFDLVAERRELYNKRISDREREYAAEIKLRNRKKTAVTIVVEEMVSGDIEITQKSHDFVRKDANTLQFTVPVPPGKEVTVSYTARARF